MQYTEIFFLQNWLLVKPFNARPMFCNVKTGNWLLVKPFNARLMFCSVKTGNDVHTRVILFAQGIGAF